MSNILYWGFPRSMYRLASIRLAFYRPLAPRVRYIHKDNLCSNFDFRTRLRPRLLKDTHQLRCKSTKKISSKDSDVCQADKAMSSAKKQQSLTEESSRSAGNRHSDNTAESYDSPEARESEIPSKSVQSEARSFLKDDNPSADHSSGENILLVEKATKESTEQNENKSERQIEFETKDPSDEQSNPWRNMFGPRFKDESMYIRDIYSKPGMAKAEPDKLLTVGGAVPHKMESTQVDSRDETVEEPKAEAKSEGNSTRDKFKLTMSRSESQRIVDAERNSIGVKGSDRVVPSFKVDVLKKKFKRFTYKRFTYFQVSAHRTNKKIEKLSSPLKRVKKQDEIKIDKSKGQVTHSSQPATSHQPTTSTAKTDEIMKGESKLSRIEFSNREQLQSDQLDDSKVSKASTDSQTTTAKAGDARKDESKAATQLSNTAEKSESESSDAAAEDEPRSRSSASKAPPRKSLSSTNVEKWMQRARQHKHQQQKRHNKKNRASVTDAPMKDVRLFPEIFPNVPLTKKFYKRKVSKGPYEAKRKNKKRINKPGKPREFTDSLADPAEENSLSDKKRPCGLENSVFGVPRPTSIYEVMPKERIGLKKDFKKSPFAYDKSYQTRPTKEGEDLKQFDSKRKAQSNYGSTPLLTEEDEYNKNAIQRLLRLNSTVSVRPKKKTHQTIGEIIAEIRQKVREEKHGVTSTRKYPKDIYDDQSKGVKGSPDATNSTHKSPKRIDDEQSKDCSNPAASLTVRVSNGTSDSDKNKDLYIDGKWSEADAGGTYGKAGFVSNAIGEVSNDTLCKADSGRDVPPVDSTEVRPTDEPYVSQSQTAKLTDEASDPVEQTKLSESLAGARAEKELDANMSKHKRFRKNTEKKRAKDRSQSNDNTAIKRKKTIRQTLSKLYGMIIRRRRGGNNDGGRRNITTYTASLGKSKREDLIGGLQENFRPTAERGEDVFISPDLKKYGLGSESIRKERKRNEKERRVGKSGRDSIDFADADATADKAMGTNKNKTRRIRGGSSGKFRPNSLPTKGQVNGIKKKRGVGLVLKMVKRGKRTKRDENIEIGKVLVEPNDC